MEVARCLKPGSPPHDRRICWDAKLTPIVVGQWRVWDDFQCSKFEDVAQLADVNSKSSKLQTYSMYVFIRKTNKQVVIYIIIYVQGSRIIRRFRTGGTAQGRHWSVDLVQIPGR